MKILTLFILLVISATAVLAQDHYIENGLPFLYTETIKILQQQQERNIAKKTTQLKERVVTWTFDNLTGINSTRKQVDSIHFSYSGSHTSFIDYNTFELNTYYCYSDTTYESYNKDIMTPVKTINHYNGTWNRDTIILQNIVAGSFTNRDRTSFVYNSNSHVINDLRDYWNTSSGSWVHSQKIHITYNSLHQDVLDSLYLFYNGVQNLSGIMRRTYNTAGLMDTLISESWNNVSFTGYSSKFIYTYYPDNNLKTALYLTMSPGSNYKNYHKDSLGYSANSTLYTLHSACFWDDLTNSWKTPGISITHFNTYMRPDTIRQYGGNFALYTTQVGIYNNNGNVTSVTNYRSTDNINIGYPYEWYNFSYETYNDPTSVPTTLHRATGISIYPNPVTSQLTIRRQQNTAGQYAIIWNIMGQQVLHQPLDAEQVAMINTTALIPGMYWVAVHDADGTLSERCRFIKQ